MNQPDVRLFTTGEVEGLGGLRFSARGRRVRLHYLFASTASRLGRRRRLGRCRRKSFGPGASPTITQRLAATVCQIPRPTCASTSPSPRRTSVPKPVRRPAARPPERHLLELAAVYVGPGTRLQAASWYWPCKSNPVRLGSYVSRAIARREIAGFRPGFWPQGQSNHRTPLRSGAWSPDGAEDRRRRRVPTGDALRQLEIYVMNADGSRSSIRFIHDYEYRGLRSKLSLTALRGSGRSAGWVDESATGSVNPFQASFATATSLDDPRSSAAGSTSHASTASRIWTRTTSGSWATSADSSAALLRVHASRVPEGQARSGDRRGGRTFRTDRVFLSLDRGILGAVSDASAQSRVLFLFPDSSEIRYIRKPKPGDRVRSEKGDIWTVGEVMRSGIDTYTVACVAPSPGVRKLALDLLELARESISPSRPAAADSPADPQ